MDAAGPNPAGPPTLIEGTEDVDVRGGALDRRAGVGASETDIVGMSGVTEIIGTLTSLPRVDAPLADAGDSLIEILGIGGVTPIEGMALLEPRPDGALTEIDGVSETEIVGMAAAEDGLKRAAGAWLTLIVGTEGAAG